MDFEKIESLSNDNILELYNNIITNNDYLALSQYSYVRCVDNNRTGSWHYTDPVSCSFIRDAIHRQRLAPPSYRMCSTICGSGYCFEYIDNCTD